LVSEGPPADIRVSTKLKVVVAGAGVFGSAIALALARAGGQVSLVDPARRADNASGVAAGMIAPVFEAVLDPLMAGRFDLLRGARDLWPGFAQGFSPQASPRPIGAAWIDLAGEPALADAHETALAEIGAQVERRSLASLRRRGLALDGAAGAEGVFTADDWLIDPGAALAALQAGLLAHGGRTIADRVVGFEAGRVSLASGAALDADRLVVATGAETPGLAPEASRLTPIKGQILRFTGAAQGRGGPILRTSLGYAAPGVAGLLAGATMEPGLADRVPTESALERLRALAVRLDARLAQAPCERLAGVRAASPDGLPLVGPSSWDGVLVAVGARRNGWLLAPLVAKVAAAYLAGREAGRDAQAFDPGRFEPTR
jgi:glycine oxidase